MSIQRLLLAASWLLVLACGPEREVHRSPPGSIPAAVDAASPSTGFDGTGTLLLGEGWGLPEGSGAADEWGSMAWVLGREAEVHASQPPGGPVDFFARCLPFPWAPGSPQQEMELLLGDEVLGRVVLKGEWQDVVIPLPDSPGPAILDLRLRFSHALKPVELGMSGDPRSLAAAFTALALVPRGIPDPRAFLALQSLDPETGRAMLPAGGGLRLPLPADAEVDVEVSSLSADCPGCELSLELSAPGEAGRVLWRGEPPMASELTVSFKTGGSGLHSLWMRVSAAPEATAGWIELGVDASWRARRSSRSEEAGKPHVFVYMIDTLRADVLGPYGGDANRSPEASAFAEEAVTYLGARAPSSWTLPSVVSMLTGIYSDRHGVMTGEMQVDPRRVESLAQLLKARGYRTAGISQSFIMSSAYGLGTEFDDFYVSNQLNGWRLRSQEAHRFLATWLATKADGAPLFAYLHTVDPHAPYSPPPGFGSADRVAPGRLPLGEYVPQTFVARGHASDPGEIAHMRALYDDEAEYADEQFGRFIDLIKWLGLYEQSIVVLVSDHGEEFFEHGGFEHGETLFEEVLRVPLMVKYPGGRWAGARIEEPVSLVDLMPTLVEELGLEPETELDGRRLPVPGAGRDRVPIYFEVAPGRDPAAGQIPIDLRGMLVGALKCIENRTGVDRQGDPAPALVAFDLAVDPTELQGASTESDALARCRRLLDGWSASRARLVQRDRSRRPATQEALEHLRALGYL